MSMNKKRKLELNEDRTQINDVEKSFAQVMPDYFSAMLCDKERNDQYRIAIFQIISWFHITFRRWPRVLDVGAGTGFLTICAVHAGAEFVVGIEANKQRASLAQENVRKHKLQTRCKIVNIKSTDFALGEAEVKFDILICELMGTMVHYELMNRYVVDLYDRGIVNVFPGGRGKIQRLTVPQRIEMWISPFVRRETDDLCDVGCDLVDQHIAKLVAGSRFRQHCEYGLVPDVDFLKRAEHFPSVPLINQSVSQPLVLTKKVVDLREKRLGLRPTYFFVEWRCQLWRNVFLENSLEACSRLPRSNFAARIASWGFALFVLPANDIDEKKKKQIVFELTENDVLIVNE